MQLVVESRHLVSEVGDLSFESRVVRLHGLNLSLESIKFRVLQRHLLVEGVNVSLEVPLLVSEVRDGLTMSLVFIFSFDALLHFHLDFKTLLLEVSDLLNQDSVLLSELLVLVLGQLQVGLGQVMVILELN